ncbi:MAG: aminoacetone oxidase family FAD-binding enzyme [Bacteroidia bacterium]|nr:aminoacetone oxidase family FAD-binding enzyme [Bacteroidia bacterium]
MDPRLSQTSSPRKVVVIGAGAAGLVAADFSARYGAEVLLLEGTKHVGKKILISGGGRCNILPAELDESRFVTDSSRNTLNRILRSWPLTEQIRYFEHELGVRLVEEAGTGKLFPASQRARDVRDALLQHAERGGVRLCTDCLVTEIRSVNDAWRIEIRDAPAIHADAVIIATGGLSIPTTGSDGFGFRFAESFGIATAPRYPALVPVTSSDTRFTSLAGISIDVRISASSTRHSAEARGALLFTHRGYSGPAVLDVSHVLARATTEGDANARLRVSWLSHDELFWMDTLWHDSRGTAAGALRRELPERLVSTLMDVANVDASRTLAQLRREEKRRLLDVLLRCALPWTGDEGYRKAEVTGGGVLLSEIQHGSMECKAHPGLYFCGETLDVFGPIGGYNFFWAWATGRAAGISAATKE